MKNCADIEAAERLITSQLAVYERLPKCVVITLIERHCGVTRRVAANYLVRLISQGRYEDLYYDIRLPKTQKESVAPSETVCKEKTGVDMGNKVCQYQSIKHTYPLYTLTTPFLLPLIFLFWRLISSHYSASFITLNGCFNG